MNLLFLSRHIPYAADSGIAVKTRNVLACLSSVCKVTCVYVTEEPIPLDPHCDLPVTNRYIAADVGGSPLRRYLKHLGNLLFVEREVGRQLDAVIDEANPDLFWLEFGYIGNFIPFLGRYAKPVIYSSHNSQFALDYSIWRCNGNPLYKLKMAPFLPLYLIHERRFFKRADLMFCVSPQDISYYRRFVSPAKLGHLPYFFDDRSIAAIEARRGAGRYVCMIGSLNSYQNYSAAIFALDQIWPLIQEGAGDLSLYIVGALPAAGSREHGELMQKSAKFNNVVFTGAVPSVIPFVKGASVNMVPLLLGSGVRTKIIESAACRTAVVSTSIGAEGLPFVDGESICLADDPLTFTAKVLELIQDVDKRERTVEKAYQVYQKELSYPAGVRLLQGILEQVSRP